MSYTRLLYHIIFRTKYSEQTINHTHADDLYRYIWGIIKNKKGHALNAHLPRLVLLFRNRADLGPPANMPVMTNPESKNACDGTYKSEMIQKKAVPANDEKTIERSRANGDAGRYETPGQLRDEVD